MIKGHGDDAYQYKHITSDFSTNICANNNPQLLMAHLATCPELIGRYPEPEAWSLERMLADAEDLEQENILVTNGATEAIYLIAQAFPMKADIPRPTFSEYEDACNLFPRTDMEHTMLWLCNPNNPTGDVYAQTMIQRMIAKYDLVVIDQSYEYYTHDFLMSAGLAAQYLNVIQIHSFTKTYGVPGIRLGYITGHEKLIDCLRHFIQPWSVSALAIEAGKFLLSDDALRCHPDMNEAQRLKDRLQQIDGVLTQATQTNFILCQLEHGAAADLKKYLANRHGMLIRDASNFRGLTDRHFRVAAQSPRENDALVNAIKDYMKWR